MTYLKTFTLLAMIVMICNAKPLKTNDKLSIGKIFPIEEKHFLQNKMDSTINFPFFPGDSIADDLNSLEKEKYILTRDAAHKYKLISIQKKTGNYIAVIVLYIMEGGNKQYMITIDKNGKAIADLLIQNNHKDGPIRLKDGNILMLATVNSYFRKDTITVVEKRWISDKFTKGANEWKQVIKTNYRMAQNGTFEPLDQ